jgi:hypothetical protein
MVPTIACFAVAQIAVLVSDQKAEFQPVRFVEGIEIIDSAQHVGDDCLCAPVIFPGAVPIIMKVATETAFGAREPGAHSVSPPGSATPDAGLISFPGKKKSNMFSMAFVSSPKLSLPP